VVAIPVIAVLDVAALTIKLPLPVSSIFLASVPELHNHHSKEDTSAPTVTLVHLLKNLLASLDTPVPS
jgi:hypothetical protein